MYTVSDLIKEVSSRGSTPLKYLTSQFWMVRMRICKNQFWLKSESDMACDYVGTPKLSGVQGVFGCPNVV